MRRLIPRFVLAVLLVGLGYRGIGASAAGPEQPEGPLGATVTAALQGPRAQGIPDSFSQVGENENFQLYANPDTLAFKVVDKRSGYVWHSNLDEVTEEDELNRTWTAFATSGISIDFLDQDADDERASITNAEHTIDFTPIDQGFEASLTFVEPSISLVVTVELEPDGVRVDIPFESVEEADQEFRLGRLHLYPFFGAIRENSVSGYMFVPDGSGTLIRLAAETKARNMFLGRYYGPDLGVITRLPFDPTTNRPYHLSVPVSGMVHGEKENAFTAVVEKGASYGELWVHPAGVTTKFNFLYNTFIYNQSYFQATNRSGEGVTLLQPATNRFDVAVHYRLLTGDESDYVGMARSYQAYLLDKGWLPEHLDPSPDIGVRLEFLGAEREKILFWHRSIPVTTLTQMSDILGQLDVRNPDVIYYGWQRGGANSMYPPALALDESLGTTRQLISFAEEVAANGRFYLYVDPQAALQEVGGYSRRHDLARSISNSNLEGANRFKLNYYLNLPAQRERYRALVRDLSSQLAAGLALDGMGSTLYSDFRNNQVLNREVAIQTYQELVAETEADTAFYLPNDYMFPYMQAYYDMPLTDSGYLYTSEVVPFLQIVLAGYVPMYGRALNFSPNLQADLLRHADFGVYPSFFLTHAPTSTILRTSSGWIFSSSYEQWGQDIEESYQWLNNLLAPVKGEQVVTRETLGNQVVATTYSNGKQIIVNHSSIPFTDASLFVEPQNAIIREVGP